MKTYLLPILQGADIKEGATFQLNKEQLANLPDNPKSS
jgi:hypothetical protein